MRTSPTIHLIDDDESLAKELANYATEIGIETRQIATVESFLAVPPPEHPGCIIIDLGKPYLGVTRLLDEMARSQLSLPVIALADEDSLVSIVRAAREGVVAILQKGRYSRDEILDAIQTAVAINKRDLEELRQRSEFKRRQATLSVVEGKILDHLWNGDEITEIATRLGLSRRTVEKHRASLMEKLNVRSFPELIAIYARFGQSPLHR